MFLIRMAFSKFHVFKLWNFVINFCSTFVLLPKFCQKMILFLENETILEILNHSNSIK
jgi:hypothetical protein